MGTGKIAAQTGHAGISSYDCSLEISMNSCFLSNSLGCILAACRESR